MIELRQNPATVTVTIRDHGPGVPENCLETIFEPFYRVGRDRSRASGGIGLGLSIARRAVELHSGRIDARNAHPGLCVAIELPQLGVPVRRVCQCRRGRSLAIRNTVQSEYSGSLWPGYERGPDTAFLT